MDRAIVEYLANAFWQVPLLVAGVAALLWALGSDVRTRHRVWLGVLAVAMLLPLRGMEQYFPASAAPVPVVTFHVASHVAPYTAAVMPADQVLADPLPDARRHEPMLVFGEVSGRWIVRIYCGVLAFCAWRILRAWIAAQGLLRRARSIDLAPRAMAIFAQAAQAQNVPLPRLRQSDETVSPVVIGARKPVLLLPAGFDQLKDDEILAALSHEFAHLARRDYLINLICQIGALPLAWHPAITYVQKRIRDTREMLCDATAAQEMASPVRYATCLVAFALRALDSRDAALATQGLSMFDNRILEERILQLTQAPEQPEPSTRLVRLAGAAIGLLMALTMALLFHITPTWAETPVAALADPVQLTPPADLPAPAEVPEHPAAPAKPAKAAPAAKPRPVVVNDEDTRRAIAEEERERAGRQRDAAQREKDAAQRQKDAAQRQQDEIQRQRDVAQAQRDEAQRQQDQVQRQRDEAQRQREAAHQEAERQREVAEQQKEEAQRQREAAHEEAQRQREVAEQQREEAQRQREAAREEARREREVAQAQRENTHQQLEEAREAMEDARRGAAEASHAYAAEIKRQVAEAMKASQSAEKIDVEKIKQEIAQATATHKAQMAELQAYMDQLRATPH